MSIQEQIIALLNGDLHDPAQVEELMHVLAVSPEKRALFVDQVRLSRAFSAAAGAVTPSRRADERLWEGIRAIDAGLAPGSAADAGSVASGLPSSGVSAIGSSAAGASAIGASAIGASAIGMAFRRYWMRGVMAVLLLGAGIGLGYLVKDSVSPAGSRPALVVKLPPGGRIAPLPGTSEYGESSAAVDAREPVPPPPAEVLAEIAKLQRERARLAREVDHLRATRSSALRANAFRSDASGSDASGNIGMGRMGNGLVSLGANGSTPMATELPEVRALREHELPLDDREWRERRAADRSGREIGGGIERVKLRDGAYLRAGGEEPLAQPLARIGGLDPLTVESPSAEAAISDPGPWRLGINNLFRLSLPRIYGITPKTTVATDREVDLSYRLGHDHGGMLTSLRLGAAAGQTPFAQVYYKSGSGPNPVDTLIEQRPALFYGRGYVAPEVIRSGIISGMMELGIGGTGIGPFVTVGTSVEASTDASFGPFDGIATHLGVSTWILWTQTGDRTYTSTNLNVQLGAALRF